MVPFPSSSHFLVLLQSLKNANPFICLCVNWWLFRPATKNIWLEDISGNRQQEKLEISGWRLGGSWIGPLGPEDFNTAMSSLTVSQNMDSPALAAVNKKENTTATLILPFYLKFGFDTCFWPALKQHFCKVLLTQSRKLLIFCSQHTEKTRHTSISEGRKAFSVVSHHSLRRRKSVAIQKCGIYTGLYDFMAHGNQPPTLQTWKKE